MLAETGHQEVMTIACDNYFFHFILNVSSPNCCTVNCSALFSKRLSCEISVSNNTLVAFRNVFLRWLKAVFTRRKKDFSSRMSTGIACGVNLITPLLTLGVG